MPPSSIPSLVHLEIGTFHPPGKAVQFSSLSQSTYVWAGVDPEQASVAIASSKNAQRATGLDPQGLFRRLVTNWTTESALGDCELP